MVKRIQGRVAESRRLLPFMAVYGIMVWLVNGLISPFYPLASKGLTGGAWVQLGCLGVSTALMVILNNSNALIRIYSRMVSASFIALCCLTCFQFNSVSGSIVGLCIIASYLCAFRSYQDKTATGWIFYAFLCLGMASLLYPQLFYFIPVFWMFMMFQLFSFSLRTFMASIIGLLTPYWFLMAYFLWQGDFNWITTHFQSLADLPFPYDYHQLTVGQILSYAWIVILFVTGTIHFLHRYLADKIKVRQFYGCFIWMSILCIVAIALQPQHYDCLMRLLIINVVPLIGHFLALTRTRITNIAFIVISVVTLLLTVFNLWMPSLTF